MFPITFPSIDPVIISFGPLAITWYSLSYVVGILVGWRYICYIITRLRLNFLTKHVEDFITYAVIGIIIGGRLGYVLLYDPIKYFLHPLDSFKTYEGGMSFHGGITGLIIAAFCFCKKRDIEFMLFTDLLAVVSPIGLFLGRLANFINAELYGRPSDVPWAIVFPGSDGQPRHPSQIYEAFLEGVVLFAVMWYLTFIKNSIKLARFNSGIFLIIYSISRIFIENFREPDAHIGFVFNYLTMGQIFSLPMLLLGLYLTYSAKEDGDRFKN